MPNDEEKYPINKKVKVVCTQCQHGYHDECLGRDKTFQVACLCMWNRHKMGK